MAPDYKLYGNFTVDDALATAGAPKYTSDYQAGEPPVFFFLHPPPNSAALFSTYGGKPFRRVPFPTNERPGSFWWAAEIQRVCDELRRNVPEVCRTIEVPQSFWDLYRYFDAHDIYFRGAQNLWNVINTLAFEKRYAQSLVEKEQKMQTNKYTPLFETLAAELLKRPEIQTKFFEWDRENQQDILRVLNLYELQSFEGFKKYPSYFREAIRLIFEQLYDILRKGLALETSLASHVDTSKKIGKCNSISHLKGQLESAHIHHPVGTYSEVFSLTISALNASLRRYLQDIETSDPFMDKFVIHNRIINGIVIVDGTSKTAARKAKYQATVASANSYGQQKGMR